MACTDFSCLSSWFSFSSDDSVLEPIEGSDDGKSSCAKSGNKTWIPPIEFNVEWTEWVTTAFTSYNRKNEWIQGFYKIFRKQKEFGNFWDGGRCEDISSKVAYPHHERMRRMHKICHVSLGSTLEAKLTIRRYWIVHKNDVVRQPSIVENFPVVFWQLATLSFESKLVLKKS